MNKEEYLNIANERSGFNKYNGIKIVDFDDEHCIVEGELRNEAMNPWGMAHGGFVYSLCDVAAGVLVSRDEHKGVTLSSNMNFLYPSRGTKLRAEGRIVKKGRTIVLIEASVFDDTGRMTARGSFEIFALE